jgi:hypothetical protein
MQIQCTAVVAANSQWQQHRTDSEFGWVCLWARSQGELGVGAAGSCSCRSCVHTRTDRQMLMHSAAQVVHEMCILQCRVARMRALYLHVCIHAYMHTRIHAYMHTRIHAQTYWPTALTYSCVFARQFGLFNLHVCGRRIPRPGVSSSVACGTAVQQWRRSLRLATFWSRSMGGRSMHTSESHM